ncbi:MAG: GNAT family acetyltransferase [Candidatus Zixiibacteriota bacterium]
MGTDKVEDLTIRPYQDSDEDAVVSLWREAFPNASARNDPRMNIRMKLAFQPELLFVALKDGELVGTVMAGYEGHRGWANFAAVRKKLRRSGIGVALMKHAEQELRKIGCIKLNLQVRKTNAEVIRFYETLGYNVEEIVNMGKTLVDE